ncbi:MAG: hypothetical protein NT020_13465 [Chloroflexales bacterium]|nr:hypothetical protein [Chloroflexales bacterium]
MQDVLVQLDSSFDQRPSYTLVAWLRHRDAQVTIGEPLAIIQDGQARKVISAPCSGRIVALYVDPGAPLLPQSVIALIRPGLPHVLPVNGINGIIVAVGLIAVGLMIIPALNGFDNQTTSNAPAPIVASSPNSLWPFGRTPQPSAIAGESNPTPASETTPEPNPTPASESIPATEATPASDITPAPVATTEVVSESFIKQMGRLITEMVLLTKEIQPWVQTKQLINPQIFAQMIRPRITRNQQIIDDLHAITNENNANQSLTDMEKQLISQVDQYINPCMAIYDAIQKANDTNITPEDLSNQYGQCNAILDNRSPYLIGQ